MASFCAHCGAQLQEGAAYCSSCGTKVAAAETQTAQYTTYSGTTQQTSWPAPQNGCCNVMLSSLCSAGVLKAAQLVSDVCGYSLADATGLVSTLPAIVSYNVSLLQAKSVAQTLYANGLDVSVYNGTETVDFHTTEDTTWTPATTADTALGSAGTRVAAAVAAVLATLTAANRLRRENAGYGYDVPREAPPAPPVRPYSAPRPRPEETPRFSRGEPPRGPGESRGCGGPGGHHGGHEPR